MPNFYRGPWRWVEEDGESYWAPPAGFAGLDVRPLAEQAIAGGTPGLGIFVGNGIITDKNYDLLAAGSWSEKVNQRVKDAMPGKYRPKGDDLLGLILDIFTDGSDPDGIDGPKPIMPTVQQRIELHCGGRSHFERFQWGDKYTGKVRDAVRRDFAATMEAAQRGELKDAEHHHRVLDFCCEKYRVDDWKEFVPTKLQKDVPGRLKHETTVTDNFNRADSTGLGASWGTVVGNGFDVVSNQARAANNGIGAGSRVRYESDLSSSDNDCQVDVITFGFNSVSVGPHCRFQSAANTTYMFLLRTVTTPTRRLLKVVAGVMTQITGDNDAPPSTPFTAKVSANGSSLKVYLASVEIGGLASTDTSISTGLRGGMQGQMDPTAGNRSIVDNFQAADLAAAGIIYTQLERGTRGLYRGMYTRWGG